MGLGPSLYVTGNHLTCHDKTDFCRSTHTKPADSVRSFQFGVRCFNPCPDLVPVFPFTRLLNNIHMIPQTKLGDDLQTKVTDGVTGLTASGAMVGSTHRTVVEHRTRPAGVSVKDGMEGTAGGVVAAEHAMVDRAMSHGTFGHKTLSVKMETVSSHYVVRQPATIDRRDEFYVVILHLQH
jgi:hypothetical protein